MQPRNDPSAVAIAREQPLRGRSPVPADAPPAFGSKASWTRLAVGGLLLLGLIVAALLALEDLSAFLEVARNIRTLPLVFAGMATIAAYLAFMATLVSSSRAGGWPITVRDTYATSFVSEAMNNLLSTGGMGGLAIRIYGFGRRGVPAGVTAGISIMSTLLGDSMIFLAINVGVLTLVTSGRLQSRGLTTIAALYVVAALVLAVVVGAFRNPARRARLADWFGRRAETIARKLGRRDLAEGEGLTRFRQDFLGFFGRMAAEPRRLVAPYAFAFLDYSLRVTCLGFAFMAVGHPISPVTLVTGFGVGVAAGALSLVPGGIGVVEGSMAAAFKFMGVPLPIAATAVVVFRTSYYVFPLACSTLFFRSMMRGGKSPDATRPAAAPTPSAP